MDEKVIESREYLMKLYKGVYTANSGVGRQALSRIDNTLANLRIRNNNLQEQLDKYKEILIELKTKILGLLLKIDEQDFLVSEEELEKLLQISDKIKGE